MLVDSKGPRTAVLLGAVLLAVGYFPLHQAYDKGIGSVPLLCIFSFFTGVGGCSAFAAAIKISALNWPRHRGTATAFPLAAFGLSAFFFSQLGQLIAPGNTGDFLFLLASGTFGIVVVSFFFLRIVPHPHYNAVPTAEAPTRTDSNRLHRTKSEESKYRANREEPEPGTSAFAMIPSDEGDIPNQQDARDPPEGSNSQMENSSLMSMSTESLLGNIIEENNVKDRAHRVDIRGSAMLAHAEFWHLFCLMGILTGVGLMTIK
jgi:hypothetical protein